MNSEEGPCEYCNQAGQKIGDAGDAGIVEPLYICDKCKNLLSDPKTALPLIRGNLAFESRQGTLKQKQIDEFMEMITGWGKLH